MDYKLITNNNKGDFEKEVYRLLSAGWYIKGGTWRDGYKTKIGMLPFVASMVSPWVVELGDSNKPV